jgi:hypothetical protein
VATATNGSNATVALPFTFGASGTGQTDHSSGPLPISFALVAAVNQVVDATSALPFGLAASATATDTVAQTVPVSIALPFSIRIFTLPVGDQFLCTGALPWVGRHHAALYHTLTAGRTHRPGGGRARIVTIAGDGRIIPLRDGNRTVTV